MNNSSRNTDTDDGEQTGSFQCYHGEDTQEAAGEGEEHAEDAGKQESVHRNSQNIHCDGRFCAKGVQNKDNRQISNAQFSTGHTHVDGEKCFYVRKHHRQSGEKCDKGNESGF